MSKNDPAERTVRDIRRKTRKQYTAEEKIRIVVSGLRGEESIAALCRREGIAEGLYYRAPLKMPFSRTVGLESGDDLLTSGGAFMGQMGFLIFRSGMPGWTPSNEPLAKIDEVVPREDFRGCLDAVWRRSDKARESRAGRKPWDAVAMFKTIILSALYTRISQVTDPSDADCV